jgi:heterodisulfide reductase subunit B
MGEQPALNARVNDALGAGGLHYDPGTVKVRHLLEVILNDVGLDGAAAVKKPLTGLKVAPYLGCMVPRPDVTAPTPTTSSRTTSTACFEPSALTSWTTRSRPSAAAAT